MTSSLTHPFLVEANIIINCYCADDEPRSHFVRPESYQVTWWPGDKPQDEINSDHTTGQLLSTSMELT